jgi:hypothetical protein
VEARYSNGEWYPAAVREIRADGTYLLEWEGGDPLERVKHGSEMRKKTMTNTSGDCDHGPCDFNPYENNYCTVFGGNCTASKCCVEDGFQCYKKNSDWASCHLNCTKGKEMPGDTHKGPWDCEELGARTAGQVHEDWMKGAMRGEDCRAKKFCAGMDDHCYLRNKDWGSCMQECDPSAEGTKFWDCEKVY